uniref:Uncharacterized protein n=1 Tax=Cacopsylla melanoneura TaxID=428564 RepID=A0A8D9E8J3_9HEMI
MLHHVSELLDGVAFRCYLSQMDQFRTWPIFEQQLLEAFGQSNYAARLLQQIANTPTTAHRFCYFIYVSSEIIVATFSGTIECECADWFSCRWSITTVQRVLECAVHKIVGRCGMPIEAVGSLSIRSSLTLRSV